MSQHDGARSSESLRRAGDSGRPARNLPPGAYGPYRDNRVLARWLVGLLVLGLLVHITRIVVNFIYSFTEWLDDEALSERIEAIFEGSRLTALSCMIVFGVWIVRSGKNAWLFAGLTRSNWRAGNLLPPKFLQDTPGWAVGWYFIPIASLWKPYVAMRDIVRASTREAGLSGWLLPTWWTFWIISQFADRATHRLADAAANWEGPSRSSSGPPPRGSKSPSTPWPSFWSAA